MRVPLVEKKLLILTWFLDSSTFFTGVIVMLLDVDFCLSVATFSQVSSDRNHMPLNINKEIYTSYADAAQMFI
jgi:hypothetical protein